MIFECKKCGYQYNCWAEQCKSCYDRFSIIRKERINHPSKKISILNIQSILNNIKVNKTIDEFEDTCSIYFSNIINSNLKHIPMFTDDVINSNGDFRTEYIGITFFIFNNHIGVEFNSNIEGINLAQSDKIIFLTKDKKKLEIKFRNPHIDRGSKKYNSYLLLDEELNFFTENEIDKWKLTSVRKGLYILGDFSNIHPLTRIDKKTSVRLIQELAVKMKNIRDLC